MEDIEYLEEYEDFILPKTLNYSQEYSANAIDRDLLEETCDKINPVLTSDDPECKNNISQRTAAINPSSVKTNLVKIINTEVLSTPAQMQNIIEETTSTANIIPITREIQQSQFRYERAKDSFLNRVSENPVLQRLDKYKSIATVKPTLQRTKSFNLSSITPPFTSTEMKIHSITNLECLPNINVNASSKGIEDDSFLDYAVGKHADDFNLEFNLDTADISDICSESMNFSDDYNDGVFSLESFLASADNAKQKLKRKNVHGLSLEVDPKKSKNGSNFYLSEQRGKTGTRNLTKIISTKSSLYQTQQEIKSKNSEKKKSFISFEKKKNNLRGNKTKLVVKKNGKKFVFPDRSKFSLKHLNNSNNIEEEPQGSPTVKSVSVAPQMKVISVSEAIKELVGTIKNKPEKMILEKHNYPGNKKDYNEKVEEKDIVIFSSPKNMKRISQPTDSEPLIYQNTKTPIKSTGLTFAHFTLKSIKPPNSIRLKEMPTFNSTPRDSGNIDEKKIEHTVNDEKKLILTSLFEPRDFSIRLSKNIVGKILQSIKIRKKTKEIKETKVLAKLDGPMPTYNVLDSTLSCSSLEKSENSGTKTQCKRLRHKNTQPIKSMESCIKSSPPVTISTECNISQSPCPTDKKSSECVQKLTSEIDNEKIPSTQTNSWTKDGRCRSNEIFLNIKKPKAKDLGNRLVNEQNDLAVPTYADSFTSEVDNIKKYDRRSSSKKNTRLTTPTSKSNNQPKEMSKTLSTPIGDPVKNKRTAIGKESTRMTKPEALADVCLLNQTTPQETNSTKNLYDVETLEPKEELHDDTVALHLRPTNFVTNDAIINKIKLNEHLYHTSINKNRTDLNVCTRPVSTFGNERNISKITIFELPSYIVMKTKIINRKDLENNKTYIPPIVKQQLETESDNIIVTESGIKTERHEFNSVCARINALIEQNANYLKFASGSERLTRMKDVLGDYSLSVEDATCTLKFLQSYLSSDPRDKAIRTRGQQFIPIYDSQKKIIGYRKRTIHVKPSSSRGSLRRMSKAIMQPSVSLTTVNVKRKVAIVDDCADLATKIEPDLIDVGESELIVPDTSPANGICIKNEEDLMV